MGGILINKINTPNLSDGSHKVFDVICDFQITEKCKKIMKTEWRIISKQRKNNNGLDICLQCSRSLKSSGRSNPNTKYKQLDDNYFNIIDTPMKAWILGWIASDGSLAKKNVCTISILKSDIKILNAISSELKCGKPKDKGSLGSSKNEMSTISINSKKIFHDLVRHLGLPGPCKKSAILKFPELKEDLKIYFIRGLFEGDGSISYHSKYNYFRISIAGTSADIKESIFEYFKCGHVSADSWEVTGKKALCVAKIVYEDILSTPILDRKYDKYINYTGVKSFKVNKYIKISDKEESVKNNQAVTHNYNKSTDSKQKV
jgi:hypothetical protein